MFQHVLAINESLLVFFERIAADLREDLLFLPSPGHGHPPVWIMGHLAITGEMGVRMLGGRFDHVRWLKLFGPGSSDHIPNDGSLNKTELVSTTIQCYRQLRELATRADPVQMAKPHTVEILQATSIRSQGDLIAHLLSSHFAAHLAQLSSCRRVEGYPALF